MPIITTSAWYLKQKLTWSAQPVTYISLATYNIKPRSQLKRNEKSKQNRKKPIHAEQANLGAGSKGSLAQALEFKWMNFQGQRTFDIQPSSINSSPAENRKGDYISGKGCLATDFYKNTANLINSAGCQTLPKLSTMLSCKSCLLNDYFYLKF